MQHNLKTIAFICIVAIVSIAGERAARAQDMPAAVSDREVSRALLQAEALAIWRSQDEIMATWPKLDDVRAELVQELDEEAPLADASVADLVDLVDRAKRHRQLFWRAGRGTFLYSYSDGYKAIILMEKARSREPTNLLVGDELVKAILTVSPLRKWDDETGTMKPSNDVIDALLALRGNQYSLVKDQVAAGRAPTLEDFARVVDFAVLQSRINSAAALEALDWLTSNAAQGGWTGYNQFLNNAKVSCQQGRPFIFNIYVSPYVKFPADFTWGRRLPSFLGPNCERRGFYLWGRDDQEPSP